MRLKNWIYIALTIVLLGCLWFKSSPVWGANETVAAATVENMAYPLPDNPSFAVLPFNDTSGDVELKYLSAGFTNTLFDALSANSSVFAIVPMSTAKYAGKPFAFNKVAEELGVRYVVAGSFQKSGDQLKIGVKMIDALKGTPVWSKTYDRKMTDILKIQDDIALNIVKSARAKYDDLVVEGRSVEGTNNVEAYLKHTNAYNLRFKRTPEGHRNAKELCQQAIALDSDYLNPYITLVNIWIDEARWGFTDSPQAAMEKARRIGQIAIDLDPSSSSAFTAMGRALYNLREHDKAIATLERAAALNPDNSDAYSNLGWTLCYAGRAAEAIPAFQKMKRLNPLNPQWAFFGIGAANLFAGNYEQAIPYYQKMIDGGSKFFRTYLDIAACQIALGRQEEAQVNCTKVMELNPRFTLNKHISRLPAKDPESVKFYTQALQKLELPQ